jgi:hypothetical protein
VERLLVCVLLVLLVLAAVPAVAQNPHDGYIFWLPSWELKVGDAASEKEFNYSATATAETFTIQPRVTRMGVAAGQLVIVRPGGGKDAPEFTVEGKDSGSVGRMDVAKFWGFVGLNGQPWKVIRPPHWVDPSKPATSSASATGSATPKKK